MIKLKELIEKLKTIRTETRTKISDEILFDNAVKIFISNRINESRDKGIPYRTKIVDNSQQKQNLVGNNHADGEVHESSRGGRTNPADNSPTDKQLFFLKKMGVTIPKTKFEATKMIKRLKDLE